MIRIQVERLGDGRVMLQVGDEWHLVLAAADAVHVGMQLQITGAGGSSPHPGGIEVENFYCGTCGHVHAGPELDGICIGCSCEVRSDGSDDDFSGERLSGFGGS